MTRSPESHDEAITEWLTAWSEGQPGALDGLMETVLDQLRGIAGGYLRGERVDHTLQVTALVHEAFLRLEGQDRIQWQNRGQFFAVASKIMRRILVDHARHHGRSKRGGPDLLRQPQEVLDRLAVERPGDVVAVDDALRSLASFDEELARIVELRYFGGLTKEQIAEVVGISRATVDRRWRLARLWLHRELTGSAADAS
ncbi:MAG: sigma-70 family RNA polymerase sigma factor [Acidobacteriota bacterium]